MADSSPYAIVTASDDQEWPCTIVDAASNSVLAVYNGTPVFRTRELADLVLETLNNNALGVVDG